VSSYRPKEEKKVKANSAMSSSPTTRAAIASHGLKPCFLPMRNANQQSQMLNAAGIGPSPPRVVREEEPYSSEALAKLYHPSPKHTRARQEHTKATMLSHLTSNRAMSVTTEPLPDCRGYSTSTAVSSLRRDVARALTLRLLELEAGS
jgi:hypothetical protein